MLASTWQCVGGEGHCRCVLPIRSLQLKAPPLNRFRKSPPTSRVFYSGEGWVGVLRYLQVSDKSLSRKGDSGQGSWSCYLNNKAPGPRGGFHMKGEEMWLFNVYFIGSEGDVGAKGCI